VRLERLHLRLERGHEAPVVEQRGPQELRELADLRERLRGDAARLRDLRPELVAAAGQAALEEPEVRHDRRQALADAVVQLAGEAAALLFLHGHEAVRQLLELLLAAGDPRARGLHDARAERGDDAREEERADRKDEAIVRHVGAVREEADQHEALREERPDERGPPRAPSADDRRSEEEERERVRQQRGIAGRQREVGEGVPAHADHDEDRQRVRPPRVLREVARDDAGGREERVGQVRGDSR
jgi:hypothetical protein